MSKTLIVLAHPNIEASRVNKSWINEARKHAEKLDIHELYKEYGDFKIDVKKEQNLIEKYEKIIFQFPLYWYSSPALLKKWLDDVFSYGWAYGSSGDKLKGKKFALAISIGANESYYQKDGEVAFSLDEIITPFKCTANFTGATLLPSFFSYGFSFVAGDEIVKKSTKEYMEFLNKI